MRQRKVILFYLALLLAGVTALGGSVLITNRMKLPDAMVHSEQEALPDRKLVNRFVQLKNQQEPLADELLAAASESPDRPVSPEEAEQFQIDCFLRQGIHIVDVRRAGKSPHRFVLVTHGNVSAPTLSVRNAQGIDRIQRTMSNPDLLVEVRDGKIHGIRAELHSGD